MEYQETQRFDQIWIWALLIGLNLIPAVGIYRQTILDLPFGNNPLPDAGLWALQLFTLFLLWGISRLRLYTSINATRINIRFYPLAQQTIDWSEVQKAEIVNYGFVGGWGIRLTSRYGTVYNTRGNMGLLLKLKNGKKVCVGTQQPKLLGQWLIQQDK